MENETYSTHGGPLCPYCGHRQNASDDPSIYYDEGLTEVECHACEQTYSCSVRVRHSWASRPKSSEDSRT